MAFIMLAALGIGMIAVVFVDVSARGLVCGIPILLLLVLGLPVYFHQRRSLKSVKAWLTEYAG